MNKPLNGQRTVAQMKEDVARRRAFQLLLDALYEGSPHIRYRHDTGRELTDDVYKRFGGHCFNCGDKLPDKGWHLDHTRPLKLLWPLDATATALCSTCNTAKRDRMPCEFYPADKLARLAEIVEVPLDELASPAPNEEALTHLFGRLSWLFTDFLQRPELKVVRDGKIAAELVVRALNKVVAKSGNRSWPDLEKIYSQKRGS